MISERLWSFAYCRTCTHTVRVLWTTMPTHEGHANIPDAPELVCLDASGPGCKGVCPLSNLPHYVMDLRLEQSGLQDR